MKLPIISIIILSYNTKNITLECLDRVKKSSEYLKKPVEVIVVENGNDGTGSIIKKKYKWVKLITPKQNTGFAVGNNLGLKIAKGKYLLCLNSDAFIQEETLSRCLEYFKNNKDCEVMGCRLNLADGRLQPSAGLLPTPENIYSWMIWAGDSVHPQNTKFFGETREVEWVMGAFMMMKKEVYEITKGFNENYFLYGEEVEWCQRIYNAGFRIRYVPDIEITHLDKSSSGGDISKGIVKEIEGLKYFIKMYYWKDWYWLRWIIKIGMLARFVIFKILGQNTRAVAHFNAFKVI